MKRNKGFTLVELLAVISILAILSGVAVISVSRIMKKNREDFYVSQIKVVTLAAKNYVQDYKSQMPKEIGKMNQILLKELVDKKYLSKVVDYKKNECSLTDSYVNVHKVSNSNYKYYVHLKCGDYTSDTNYETGSLAITFDLSKLDNIGVNIADNGNRIASYSYILYKNNKEIKNSGNVNAHKAENVNFNIDLSSYEVGNYKVVVTAIDSFGTKTKATSEEYQIVANGSLCNNITGQATGSDDWTNQNRTITVNCGSRCQQDTYTTVFDTSRVYGYISVKDKEGNDETCRVLVNVDKTAPSIPYVYKVKWKNNNDRPTLADVGNVATYTNTNQSSSNGYYIYTSGWSNKKIFTLAKGSSDSHSGGVYYQYTTGGSTTNVTDYTGSTRNIEANGVSSIKYRACDKLGNCSNYTSPVEIKVDTVEPICGNWAGNSTTWTNANRTITVGCTDSISGCRENPYNVATYSSGTTKTVSLSHTIYDNAGNSRICTNGSVNVYVDKTQPSCGTWSGSTTWTNANRTITVGCTDSGSGCAASTYNVATYSSGTTKTASLSKTISDNVGNSRTCSNSSVNVYVDKDAPTVPNVIYKKWSNNSTDPSDNVTTINSLSNYSTNTWSNKKIYTQPYGSTDTGSGLHHYEYTTTGATTNSTNHQAGYRNIAGNGVSYIKYRACDNVGNCSNYGSRAKIKVDKTDPTISFGTLVAGKNKLEIYFSTDDSMSGVDTVTCKYGTSSGNYNKSGTVNSAKNKCTISGLTAGTKYYYQITAKDKAGNSYSRNGNTKTSSNNTSTTTPVTNCSWYMKASLTNSYLNLVFTPTSGCSFSKVTNTLAKCTTYDSRGNAVACTANTVGPTGNASSYAFTVTNYNTIDRLLNLDFTATFTNGQSSSVRYTVHTCRVFDSYKDLAGVIDSSSYLWYLCD